MLDSVGRARVIMMQRTGVVQGGPQPADGRCVTQLSNGVDIVSWCHVALEIQKR